MLNLKHLSNPHALWAISRDWLANRSRRFWAGSVLAALLGAFLIPYTYFAIILHKELAHGAYADTVDVAAAPLILNQDEALDKPGLIKCLKDAGYSTDSGNPVGWFEDRGASVAIHAGPAATLGSGNVEVQFAGSRIRSLKSDGGKTVASYALEPALFTNLESGKRERRRLLKYNELPPVLVHALLSAEDKRFFQHNGFDIVRIGGAAFGNLREGRKGQGASTLTMQLVRTMFLNRDKTWGRKVAEAFLTLEMERSFSKEEILEMYANQIYLGRTAAFNIHGFGEAASVYFGKNVRDLTLPEAAALAGLVQRPGYFNISAGAEALKDRRDTVLRLMEKNGFITESKRTEAQAQPMQLAARSTDTSAAAYYLDLLNREMEATSIPWEDARYRVETTIDLQLQTAAQEAITAGMKIVDKQLARNPKTPKGAPPQVALVALDPHTGAVLALSGGRDYQRSQLNRAMALRQPGSSFKPFVFAAALGTPLEKSKQRFTPATLVDDTPTTFQFGDEAYTPGNFGETYNGLITLRRALAKSANIATIKVAEATGYKRVADLARAAGLKSAMGTPSVALGSYDTTPLELAGAYTIFSNGGEFVKPHLIRRVTTKDGRMLYEHQAESKKVLDPRVAFLMVNLLEEVMRSGTGAAVYNYGLNTFAAGKTGTSRDGWFAGFTDRLLCVVWVGYDDNREMPIEAAKSAVPVWAEFVKRAELIHGKGKPFPVPGGLETAEVCPESGGLPSNLCEKRRTEYFLPGTSPQEPCDLHTPTMLGRVAGSWINPATWFQRR